MARRLSVQWTTPAVGAEALQPYPVSVVRWAMIAALFAYAQAGRLGPHPALNAVLLVGAPAAAALADGLLFWNRNRPQRLLACWAFVHPLDIAVIMLAGAADGQAPSHIPVIAIMTLFLASAMFRASYVIRLAVFAALATAASQLLLRLAGDPVAYWDPVFSGVIILCAGALASTRGTVEERLRESLIDARIREREQAEVLLNALETARQSEARFMAFSKHAPAVLMVYDHRGRLTFASSYLEALTGVPVLAAGRIAAWRERIPPDELEALTEAVRTAVAGERVSLEVTVMGVGGRPLRLAGTWFPMERGAGAIIRDVTEERLLAQHLARARQLETLGTLAGGIAHDFNNLLTTIIGNLHIARGIAATEPPDLLDCLDDANRAAERGADLVRRLLAYGRPALDHTEVFPLEYLVKETAALARRGVTSRVELVTHIPTGSARVKGNFAALQQVLLNLLVNGADAMPAGGRLTVDLSDAHVDRSPVWSGVNVAPGLYHVVTITDTGTGIPRDWLMRIFDPFFTTKEVGKGTGLGLSSALGTVRAHGGWLDVESEEGHGSSFRILLPAHAAQEAAA